MVVVQALQWGQAGGVAILGKDREEMGVRLGQAPHGFGIRIPGQIFHLCSEKTEL